MDNINSPLFRNSKNIKFLIVSTSLSVIAPFELNFKGFSDPVFCGD